MRSWACWAISAPWSQVSDRRSCSGKVVMDEAIASRTGGADCGAAQSEDEIAFPVSWDLSVLGVCWSLSDHDVRCDEALSASPGAGLRDPQCSPGP